MRGIIKGLCRPSIGSIFSLSVLFSLLTSTAHAALVEQLEKGEIISAKTSNGVLMHGLVRQDYNKIMALMSGGAKGLVKQIPSLGSIRGFVTTDGTRLAYLKVRGVVRGLGLMMEVKSGLDGLFEKPIQLPFASTELRLGQTPVGFSSPLIRDLQSDMDQVNKVNKDTPRSLGMTTSFVLDGPVDEVMEIAGVRVNLQVSIQQYTLGPKMSSLSTLGRSILDESSFFLLEEKADSKAAPASDPKADVKADTKGGQWSLFNIQMTMLPEPVKGEFSDLAGITTKKMEVVQFGAEKVLRNLRMALESIR